MKREIKFRGKRADNGAWVYGYIVVMAGTHRIFSFNSDSPSGATWYDVDPETVGQFTGMKDCNGKEIYEGDIVEITSYFTHPRSEVFVRIKAEVKFKDGAFVAVRYSGRYDIANFLEDVEVHGNVFDNSEMLKGGEG